MFDVQTYLAAKSGKLPASPDMDMFSYLLGKSQASPTKTITGVPPFTFKSNGDNLVDWSITGSNEVGKNLVNLAGIEDKTSSGVTFHVDAETGTITITGDGSNTDPVTGTGIGLPPVTETTNLYMTGYEGDIAGVVFYCWDITTRQRATRWDGVTTSTYVSKVTRKTEVQLLPGHEYMIYPRVNASFTSSGEILTPMLRLPDTSADFEPYQIGVGERTKNLLEITATSGRVNNVNFSVDKDKGTISVTSEGATNVTTTISWQRTIPAGNHIFSAQLQGSNSTYRMDVSMLDWTFLAVNYSGDSSISLNKATTLRFRVVIYSDYTANNVIFKPMLRADDTDADFIPYGYEIPVICGGTTTDIFIGDSPLGADDTVSKISTGVDIPTSDGNNTLSVDTYVQPSEMSITYHR